MINVFVKPRGYEEWLDKVIGLVKDVYGDRRLEPLNIIAFTRDEEYSEALDWVHRLAGDIISGTTVIEIALGLSAIYIQPVRLIVIPVTEPAPLYWYTESFFHEVTHHVIHNTGTIVELSHRLLKYAPTLMKHILDKTVAKAYTLFVDELFAHYVEACYLRKLSRRPCKPIEWFKKATSLSRARRTAVEAARKAGANGAVVEKELTLLEYEKAFPELHEFFTKIAEHFPADVYEKYKEIFEGREKVIEKEGDP